MNLSTMTKKVFYTVKEMHMQCWEHISAYLHLSSAVVVLCALKEYIDYTTCDDWMKEEQLFQSSELKCHTHIFV